MPQRNLCMGPYKTKGKTVDIKLQMLTWALDAKLKICVHCFQP